MPLSIADYYASFRQTFSPTPAIAARSPPPKALIFIRHYLLLIRHASDTLH
jgi:hypothetical protein